MTHPSKGKPLRFFFISSTWKKCLNLADQWCKPADLFLWKKTKHIYAKARQKIPQFIAREENTRIFPWRYKPK